MHSAEYPEKYLTFAAWIYQVPQYKPKSVLMLGYANGTIAGLIRKIYGDDVQITAVDIKKCQEGYSVNLIQGDADEFVKTCENFDCVIVDLFNDDYKVPEFVYSYDFARNLSRISNYIIINNGLKFDLTYFNESMDLVAKINLPGIFLNTISYYKKKGSDLNLIP